MATGIKLTEKQVAGSVKSEATFLITQPEGESGSEVESIRRAQMGDVVKALQKSELLSGEYENLTAGSAKYLLTQSGIDESVPYLHRKSGGSADIGKMMSDLIVGGTVCFNQIVKPTDTSVMVPEGHKFLSRIGGVWNIDESDGTVITVNSQSSDKDEIFDLTHMFRENIADYIYSLEQTLAGEGVKWFRNLFGADFYEYNAGELLGVKTSCHKTVGFNVWDEQWERGAYNTTTGEPMPSTTNIRSCNAMHVFGGTVYRVTAPKQITVLEYDASDNFITGEIVNNNTFTTDNNTRYIRFNVSGTTLTGKICINISDSSRDGEYEPHKSYSYALDATLTLNGVLNLDEDHHLYYDGDIYEGNGTVTRKYEVITYDGTETWTRQTYTGASYYGYYASIKGLKKAKSDGNCLVSFNWLTPGEDRELNIVQITNSVSGDRIYVYLSKNDYSTDTSWKNYLTEHPLTVMYELSTPEKEYADPYDNYQVVDKYGTEEYIDTRIVPMPVGHITRYLTDLKSKIEDLPDSPNDGDGDYVLHQEEGTKEYVRKNIATTEEIAPVYSSSSTYAVGDYCIHDDKLYCCKTAITTAEAWTAAHWEATDIAGEVADLKGDLRDALFSYSAKQSLLSLLSHVAWKDDDGQEYLDDLEDLLIGDVVLSSITAVFDSDGNDIFDTASLNDLKQYLTVTANYSDGGSEIITNYNLYGAIELGQCTITVAYGGKTATFTVTVVDFPSAYTKLAYLTSTGTQYIDTGAKWNTNETYEITGKGFCSNTSSAQWYAGAYQVLSGSARTVGLNSTANASTVFFRYPDSSSGATTGHNFTPNPQTEYIVKQDKNVCYLDNVEHSEYQNLDIAFNVPMYLFARNNSGTSIDNYAKYSVKRFRYWNGDGELITDLIPCLDEHNVPCMFDLVSKQTKYNSGTGTFSYEEVSA